jgi:hypothetical protein
MDVHPTKNASIGIDPYPYFYTHLCVIFHISGKSRFAGLLFAGESIEHPWRLSQPFCCLWDPK